ncbi:MAG: 30S ribosomal protein S6 [Deltaproteobacteria bacterium]|nr:30S ribosomal protein S6 [Deltaproteobacteria bacterium]MCL5277540.1 30S ribosomal protein S6 [Deltaproteobacteria bacterium]
MIRKYELMYIVDSSLPEEGIKSIVEKINNVIGKKGELVEQQNLGEKKLAYTIKKRQKGVYIFSVLKGEQETVNEAERTLKITDGVLRYLTIRADTAP